MAERITSLPDHVLGAPPKYPWAQWADGSVWRIVRGSDYEVPSTSMAATLRQHAARNGLSVVAVRARDADAVDFQFKRREPRAAA